MNTIRNVIRSNFALRATNPSRSLSFLSERTRLFSTEADHPPSSESPPSVDAFLKAPHSGPIYGKLFCFTRHTLKTDIMNLLECNLTPDDIKFSYTRSAFQPLGTFVRFASRFAYADALRSIAKKGKLYRLERVVQSQWDHIAPYDGKAILLQGIPRFALQEDVERFLSGCDYDQTSMQLFTRPGIPDPIKMAVVRFPSQTQAMNAFITKNRGFCLNNQITVRVLQ